VRNTGTAPLTVVIRSPFGASQTLTAAPGANASAAFTTRAASVPAASLTATAGSSALTAAYPARAC
jgi:hypothetical protein